MLYQADVIGEPAAAYQTVWAAEAEDKVDNRAYALATLEAWAEVAGSEPVPAFDAQAVPEQPVPAALAADYADLLA